MTRDMTKAQFAAACRRRNFSRRLMGYFALDGPLLVYVRNVGRNRRAQLAYMIREHDRWLAKQEATQ